MCAISVEFLRPKVCVQFSHILCCVVLRKQLIKPNLLTHLSGNKHYLRGWVKAVVRVIDTDDWSLLLRVQIPWIGCGLSAVGCFEPKNAHLGHFRYLCGIHL